MGFWRQLSAVEVEVFKACARRDYVPMSAIDGSFHPVYQAECVAINVAHGATFDAEREIAAMFAAPTTGGE